MINSIEWIECVCDRCGRAWVPRAMTPLPVQCAACRRRDWNKKDVPEPAKSVEEQKPAVEAVADDWIDDGVSYENGEILYWHHKPKCKPVIWKRESNTEGA